MIRSSVVRLEPDKEVESKLKALCSLSSKLWNEINYARRRQFFESGKVDIKGTYKKFYEKYKGLIGSATAQQVLNKNNEAWRSFFNLLGAKKRGKLPPFMKVNPPGYKKEDKSRKLWTVLRNDQYEISGGKIIVRGVGPLGRMEILYKGVIHLKGKKGRMEIHFDPDGERWYAHIAFDVEEKLVRGEWRGVPFKPKGGLIAGVDLGVNNLFAVYVENGESILINGKPVKSISYYWQRKISRYQSTLNKNGYKTSRKLRKMYAKWRKQVKHYINTAVRRLAEWLYESGVSIVRVGYPKNIAQQNGNFINVQIWSYHYVLKRLEEVLEEYGIQVKLVNEAYSSTTCPLHGKCGKRISRGLFKCTTLNKVFNADIVGACNILLSHITPSPLKGIGVTGRRPAPRPNPYRYRDVVSNLPALANPGTLAL